MEGAIELAEEVFHVPVGWGCRNPCAACRKWCAIHSQQAWGCCLRPGQRHAARRGRSLGGNAKTVVGPHAFLFQGNFEAEDDETDRQKKRRTRTDGRSMRL